MWNYRVVGKKNTYIDPINKKERVEKERIHAEVFVGTPTLKELIEKMYAEYQEYIRRERPENLRMQ